MDEKRRFPRYEASLQCYIEKMFEETGRIYSNVVNRSMGGMQLVSGCQCLPGDALKIVMSSEYSLMELADPVYHVGMVRWCSEQEGFYNGIYAVGVEIAERIQAPLRSSGSGTVHA